MRLRLQCGKYVSLILGGSAAHRELHRLLTVWAALRCVAAALNERQLGAAPRGTRALNWCLARRRNCAVNLRQKPLNRPTANAAIHCNLHYFCQRFVSLTSSLSLCLCLSFSLSAVTSRHKMVEYCYDDRLRFVAIWLELGLIYNEIACTNDL